MSFLLFDRMWKQVEIGRQDSDTAMFMNLMYFGELLMKLTGAGLASAIMDDRDRHRYQQAHRLVRANGIGEWSTVIDDILTGPASQHLMPSARTEQKELTMNCGVTTWQYESVRLLNICLKEVDPGSEALPQRVSARRWFSTFAELRNETRGHGVPQAKICSRISPALKESISLFAKNHSLYARSWVYLHRNLSGRFRVTALSDRSAPFDYLKATSSAAYEDGVYIHFDQHAKVELMSSDPEASDFFFPNGAFNGKYFEMISYYTGSKLAADARPYLAPSTALPESHTQGTGVLDVQGSSFGNLPPPQPGYVHRPALEGELSERLRDDRHPVVTLVGSGGIGKTSLALSVLHDIANGERFGAMLWFSARDIDLLVEGPKLVKPQVLTEKDIAEEFARLMRPEQANDPEFRAIKYLAGALTSSPIETPLLFVFDNFETVRNPAELYVWIDTYIRSPNKVLVTTRFRDFKGDYPVQVSGMTESECHQLIDETASVLKIRKLITDGYKQDLIRESDGHPYVIKILLGELAKAGRLQKIERIVADRAQMLDALFERTYNGLSPAAKQLFLTLSNWRSVVPQLAVEAVMLRPSNEKLNVGAAIDELTRSSLIELNSSPDNNIFLSVPLVAGVFGKRKLSVSPLKSTIDANTEILRLLGAAQKTDIRHGIDPRVTAMFGHIAARIGKNNGQIDEYVPIMEFVAQRHPSAWLLLARIYEESGLDGSMDRAKETIRRYLQTSPSPDEQRPAWQKLSELCAKTKDWTGEVHAQVEMCELLETPFAAVSNTANRLNGLLFSEQFLAMDDKKALLQRLSRLMDARIVEGDATDCSRLAWLYLHLQNERRALELAEQGLLLEPYNDFCRRLKRKIVNRSNEP